jgi:hypothetical protein
MQEALKKVLPHLPGGQAVTNDVNVILRALAEARAA